jgi:C-terminal processing protease CtpA/Prc
MTGMEYFFDGDDFTHLIIGRIEPGSAADNVDLLKDDEILSINFRPIEKMSLEQVDELFRSRNGRSLLLEIYRDKKHYNVILTLKKRI